MTTAALPPALVIVGATGTGKSALGLELAASFAGEVVNTDAMQVYRGMDIGTAKLPAGERRGIPHHLLDVWPVTAQANVAEYQHHAREVMTDIGRRARMPVLVGGSGLYVSAAIDAMEFPGHDPQVRAALEADLAEIGSHALHDRLAQRDPQAASAILPGNGRRIVRALEVITITGRPFTAVLPQPTSVMPVLILGIRRSRHDLDAALERRVEQMWAAGFVDEVAGLQGLGDSPTASRAVGYRQILDYLAGRHSEDDAKQATIKATRKLARRQESWFGRDPRVTWIDAGEGLSRRAQDLVSSFTARQSGT